MDVSSYLEFVAVSLQSLVHFLRALRVVGRASGVHAGGHVHGVAPDVVLFKFKHCINFSGENYLFVGIQYLRLPRSDDARHHRPHVQADAEGEVVVGVL